MKEIELAIQKKSQLMDEIKAYLGPEEVLAQFAEECAELGQAALKLRRGLDGRNVTPVSILEAEINLQEEIADVLMLMHMVGIDSGEVASNIYKKMSRWYNRLGLPN